MANQNAVPGLADKTSLPGSDLNTDKGIYHRDQTPACTEDGSVSRGGCPSRIQAAQLEVDVAEKR